MQISESSIGDCDGDRGTTELATDAYGSPRLDNAGRVVFAHLALVRVFGFPRALLWLGLGLAPAGAASLARRVHSPQHAG